MVPARFRFRLIASCLLAVIAGGSFVEAAQLSEQKKAEGFVAIADGDATGRELTEQSELWMLEVRFKPLRLIWVDTVDPATGKAKKEMVWYLVYQAVARPQEGRVDDADLDPVNVEDPPSGPPLFIPEFTLVTTGKEQNHVYRDVIFPEAMEQILRREKKPLKNSVEVVGPIPPVTPHGSAKEHVIDGVAIFRGVDPRTDFFRILMGGFTNAYRIVEGPDGDPTVVRKTIIQKYTRPGDEFLQNENEIRLEGEPEWLYLPKPESPGTVPAGALDEAPSDAGTPSDSNAAGAPDAAGDATDEPIDP